MSEFKHEERISPEQAAERLADIAFTLTTGGTLELRAEGKEVRVPVPREVVLKRESKPKGDHVEVKVGLSWYA
jgi:amphi-Trp domain-containing protein